MESASICNVSESLMVTDDNALMNDESFHRKRNVDEAFEDIDHVAQLGNVYDLPNESHAREDYIFLKMDLAEKQMLDHMHKHSICDRTLMEAFNKEFDDVRNEHIWWEIYNDTYKNHAEEVENHLEDKQQRLIEAAPKNYSEQERIAAVANINMAYMKKTLTQEMLTDLENRFGVHITFDHLKEHHKK
jgi:hypothetical protein